MVQGKKSFKWIVLAAALCLPLSAMGKTLRYSTPMPPLSVDTINAQEFFKELGEKTDQRVKGKVYSSGQLVSANSTLSGIQNGVVDGGFIIPTTHVSEIPTINILPELFAYTENPWAATGATNETIMHNCPDCLAELDKINVQWLGGVATSPWYLMCGKPIEGIADIQNKKIRVSSGSSARLVQALGSSPVRLPGNQIPSALQQGVIDCAVGNLTWLKAMGLEDMVRGIVDAPIGVYHGVGQFIFNKNSLDELSEADRAVFNDLAVKYTAKLTQRYVNEHEENYKRAKESKKIVFWNPDDAFNKAIAQYIENETANIAADIIKIGGSGQSADIIAKHIETLKKWDDRTKPADFDFDRFNEDLKTQVFAPTAALK